MTFRRNRILPPTPPSFVKLLIIVILFIRGWFNSIPITDHVPELMNAHLSLNAGTAATALAVS